MTNEEFDNLKVGYYIQKIHYPHTIWEIINKESPYTLKSVVNPTIVSYAGIAENWEFYSVGSSVALERNIGDILKEPNGKGVVIVLDSVSYSGVAYYKIVEPDNNLKAPYNEWIFVGNVLELIK